MYPLKQIFYSQNFCKHLIRCHFSSLNELGTFDAKLVQEHYFKRMSDREEYTGETYDGAFKMILPPPNVTGNLHVGHALTVAVEDSICRFQNILGKNICWIPGFDHAGIATQLVVEKQIYRRYGKKKDELTNDMFLQFCERWKEERIHDITNQLNSLCTSLDWRRLFYTMDQNFTNAVRTAFCRLYEMGLIKREKRMVQAFDEDEPTLKEQWFLNMEQMCGDLMTHLDSGTLHLDPPSIRGKLVEFLKFREPWCLSRQLLWGHKIPAYFVQNSKRWIIAPSKEEAQMQLVENEKDSELLEDPDVLDTWFSSSLIPIIVAGWPDTNIEAPVLDLMETGHDIVGFWVARMLMMCHRLTGHFPFSNVLVHGLIQDSQNRKMSKSLGNVIDPMDIINGITLQQMIDRMRVSNLATEEMDRAESDLRKRFPKGLKACSADGLRFALLRHDLTDYQIKIDIPKFAEEGKRFCNKIWNMCKYAERIFSTNKELARSTLPKNEEDEKILRRLGAISQLYLYYMSMNRPHLAFDHLYKFILCDVCDIYLESTKQSLWTKDHGRLAVISNTLEEVISTALHLLQTFMPFVCTFLLDTLKFNSDVRREQIKQMLQELPKLTDEQIAKFTGKEAKDGENDRKNKEAQCA